jgi:hypothetical protein
MRHLRRSLLGREFLPSTDRLRRFNRCNERLFNLRLRLWVARFGPAFYKLADCFATGHYPAFVLQDCADVAIAPTIPPPAQNEWSKWVQARSRLNGWKKTRRDPVDPHRRMVFDVLSAGRNRGAVDQNSESAIQVRDECGQL